MSKSKVNILNSKVNNLWLDLWNILGLSFRLVSLSILANCSKVPILFGYLKVPCNLRLVHRNFIIFLLILVTCDQKTKSIEESKLQFEIPQSIQHCR